jgi:hypothetical protein
MYKQAKILFHASVMNHFGVDRDTARYMCSPYANRGDRRSFCTKESLDCP